MAICFVVNNCYYPMAWTQMHQTLFSLFIVVLQFSLLTFLSSHSRCEAHRVLACSQSIFRRLKRMIQGLRTSWCWSVGSMDGRLQGGLSAAAPMLLAKERALELDGSKGCFRFHQTVWKNCSSKLLSRLFIRVKILFILPAGTVPGFFNGFGEPGMNSPGSKYIYILFFILAL
jgi:hypothetical protein